jgi:hypothetical protein
VTGGSAPGCSYSGTFELAGSRGRGNGWMSVVVRGELTAVGAGRSLVVALHRSGRGMVLVGKSFLFGGGSGSDAAMTSVEADVTAMCDNYLGIDIVKASAPDIAHAGVIKKAPALPVAAAITDAGVAEAVVNSAVEADLRSPVSFVPDIGVISPSPVAGRPEQTSLGCFNPCAGNPEIAAVFGVTPITGCPDITWVRANGLCVNGEHRWSDGD